MFALSDICKVTVWQKIVGCCVLYFGQNIERQKILLTFEDKPMICLNDANHMISNCAGCVDCVDCKISTIDILYRVGFVNFSIMQCETKVSNCRFARRCAWRDQATCFKNNSYRQINKCLLCLLSYPGIKCEQKKLFCEMSRPFI